MKNIFLSILLFLSFIGISIADVIYKGTHNFAVSNATLIINDASNTNSPVTLNQVNQLISSGTGVVGSNLFLYGGQSYTIITNAPWLTAIPAGYMTGAQVSNNFLTASTAVISSNAVNQIVSSTNRDTLAVIASLPTSNAVVGIVNATNAILAANILTASNLAASALSATVTNAGITGISNGVAVANGIVTNFAGVTGGGGSSVATFATNALNATNLVAYGVSYPYTTNGVIVSGAGKTAVNGTYYLAGTNAGAPFYTNGVYTIGYSTAPLGFTAGGTYLIVTGSLATVQGGNYYFVDSGYGDDNGVNVGNGQPFFTPQWPSPRETGWYLGGAGGFTNPPPTTTPYVVTNAVTNATSFTAAMIISNVAGGGGTWTVVNNQATFTPTNILSVTGLGKTSSLTNATGTITLGTDGSQLTNINATQLGSKTASQYVTNNGIAMVSGTTTTLLQNGSVYIVPSGGGVTNGQVNVSLNGGVVATTNQIIGTNGLQLASLPNTNNASLNVTNVNLAPYFLSANTNTLLSATVTNAGITGISNGVAVANGIVTNFAGVTGGGGGSTVTNVTLSHWQGDIVTGSTASRISPYGRFAQFQDAGSTLCFFNFTTPNGWTTNQTFNVLSASVSGISTATYRLCSIPFDGTTNTPTSFTSTNFITVISGASRPYSNLVTAIPAGDNYLCLQFVSGNTNLVSAIGFSWK